LYLRLPEDGAETRNFKTCVKSVILLSAFERMQLNVGILPLALYESNLTLLYEGILFLTA